MDRRYASDGGVAQVKVAEPHVAFDGCRDVIDIGNDPHLVSEVERLRLLGNVRGRKMVMHETAAAGRHAFTDDNARVVIDELVDHDAAVPGDLAIYIGRSLRKLRDACRALETRAGRIELDEEWHSLDRIGFRAVELDDDKCSAAVCHGVERPVRPLDAAQHGDGVSQDFRRSTSKVDRQDLRKFLTDLVSGRTR